MQGTQFWYGLSLPKFKLGTSPVLWSHSCDLVPQWWSAAQGGGARAKNNRARHTVPHEQTECNIRVMVQGWDVGGGLRLCDGLNMGGSRSFELTAAGDQVPVVILVGIDLVSIVALEDRVHHL